MIGSVGEKLFSVVDIVSVGNGGGEVYRGPSFPEHFTHSLCCHLMRTNN